MTETDFLNNALGKAGLPQISSINDSSSNAAWCRIFYPPLRQAQLRGHHWNFATRRATLNADVTPPAFGYAFAYPLPNGYLKITEYNGDRIDLTGVDPAYWFYNMYYFKIEGNKLMTNDAYVNIVYIADVGPELWPADFFQYLSALLAADLISAVYKDPKRVEAKTTEAMTVWLPLALAADGQEGSTAPFIVDDLTRGRF